MSVRFVVSRGRRRQVVQGVEVLRIANAPCDEVRERRHQTQTIGLIGIRRVDEDLRRCAGAEVDDVRAHRRGDARTVRRREDGHVAGVQELRRAVDGRHGRPLVDDDGLRQLRPDEGHHRSLRVFCDDVENAGRRRGRRVEGERAIGVRQDRRICANDPIDSHQRLHADVAEPTNIAVAAARLHFAIHMARG